ncbi:collagen alpha-6(VI) chain-like [Chiloscyllium punctatum]|uniref:Collagen type VI alpha 6 chain n=1 Tax=Chiloscyllium punctatum TaxID=137246 RepID=A0A401S363_CHIPU|nr:hypothetical protein [Chiloscyllium punctatum]
MSFNMAQFEVILIGFLFTSLTSTVAQQPACSESSLADIVFLVDGSWSIGIQNFKTIQEFLYTLVNGFDVGLDKVRIGLIQYSGTPRTEFFLNSYSDKNEILQYLQQLPYKGGGTRTGLGLKFMLNKHFVESAGSRASMGVPQVAIVITDGQSQDSVGLPAKALRDRGVTVYAIGIKDAVEKELEEIASKPASNYVYNVADFAALRGISQAVIQFVCTRVEEVTRNLSQVSQVSPACRKATLADIVLVVDGSTSVSDENFEEVREFLNTFVNGLDIAENKVRIGLVQYSDDPKTEFLLNQYSSKSDVLNYLQRLQQKRGRTDTRRTLEFLQNQHFVPAAGSRAAENVQQIVILVTDGDSITEVDDAANRLRNSGVTIYVIGINIQGKKEFQDISSRPVQRYAYYVANFLGMKEISNKILESVCKTVEAHIQAFAVNYADIVFLVDGSQNMGAAGFQQIRSFIFRIVTQLDVGADKYRIGLAQYDNNARTEFLLNTYITKIQVANYIRSDRSFAFQGGPGLAMGRAIDFLRRTFFRESAGSRKGEGVPQIVIMITSASSQDDITLPARALKKEGVKVISVGVRQSVLIDLQRVAFQPNFPFVFQISALDAVIQSSDKISNAIRQLVRREFRYREMRRPPVCQSATVADIVFLVDQSDSIGAVNFQLLRVFLHNMINALEVEAESVHIGLAQYSTIASEDFNLKMYRRKSDILDHIKSIRYSGGGRNTGIAIDFVRKNYFTEQAGSRARKGIPQILIVITSGESQDAVKDNAAILRRLGITVYALGIQNATESELKKIASHPSKTYISMVKDFTQLSTIEGVLQKKICNEIIEQTAVQSVQIERLKQGCAETEEADIFFLVDGSDSIFPEKLMDMKRFLVDVVNVFSIGADKVRVGVVQYADSPRIEFGITQYTRQSDLERAIKQIFQMGGSTATGQALTYMKNLFSDAVRSRRERVRHILIIITSGQSDDPVGSPAAELRRQGVDIYAIGVGNADESELLQIGGIKGRIFYVTNFDALKNVKNNILWDLCSEGACRKLDIADIIFVIDGSGSINPEDFRKMKTFMNAIVNKTFTEADNVHIGLIQFASSPKLEFELSVHSVKADLLAAINDMQQLGGGTLTGDALRLAVDYFDEAKGGRPDVPQYLVVITDGEAQDEVLQPAKAIRDKGVTVFAVGIFNANSTQLLEIGGAWDKVHYVENFDLLDSPEKQVLWEICSQPEVCLRTEAADILFVVDGSGNIQPYDFERMKRFMMTLVNSSDVSPSKVQFGAILYNNDPDVQFRLSQFGSKNEVRQAISRMQMKEGPSFTARALQQAKELLALEKGSRQTVGVSQFVIVITDEEAADSSEIPGAAEDIREDGVTVLAVGVAGANERELEAIGGSRENYLYVQDFDALKNIVRDFSQLVCANTNPVCDLQQADIVFLVDGSESIIAEDFSYIKSFMKNMVSFFSIVPCMCQFGLAQFSTSFQKEFDLKDFPNRKMLMAEIEKMVQLNQGTQIGSALMQATRLFTREAGSRKALNVPQFLIVITDGRSKENVMGPADNLRGNGIQILSVGVGQADLKQLLQISGSRDRIYFVDSFRDLGKIKQRIARSLCKDQPIPGCTIDVAVGVDLPSQARFSNAVGSQLNLQMQYLDSLIQRMTDLQNISCIAGHSLNVRAGFHITDRVGRTRFDSNFESYNLDVLGKARSFLLSAMDQISLTADYLLSFASKFEQESGKNVKMIVMFTNGIADSMNRLKEASNRLRLNGVNALITVAMENTVDVDELHELEFGRGFGYKRRLAIGMRDIGDALRTEIDTVAERECCDIICKCLGQLGKHGRQGEQGVKGILGPPGTLGYAGEDGGMGDRGPPGITGPRGIEGCQGSRGFMGERGYRGEKGEAAENGAPGTNGEQGESGIHGVAGPKGDNGNTGIKGPTGYRGERGDVGIPGDPGNPGRDNYVRGYPGQRGDPGVPGERGRSGTLGFRGSKGNNGRPGRRGLVGKTGVRGPSGYPGSIGPSGLHGQQGSTGTVGLKGVKGEQGLPGIPGTPGLLGFRGAKGSQGLQGQRGVTGDMGEKGESGTIGPRGPQGLDGYDGTGRPGSKGQKGVQGPPGYPGQQGVDGPPGIEGRKGPKGIRGRRGDSGLSGDPGNPGEAGFPGVRGFKGPPGIIAMKPCELVSYIREKCSCCSSGGIECPVYPTELVFAVDMSSDITPTIFNRMKTMVINFVQDLKITESNCPTGARVAILTYSSSAKTFIRFSDFRSKQKLLEGLQNLTYERSSTRRNVGTAMRFAAKNTFKRVRSGVLGRKVAVFITNGSSREISEVATAALEFSALDITPVVISFGNVPEIQRAFEVDDTRMFQVVVLSRQQQEAQEQLRKIRLCTFCFDRCEPNTQCQQAISPPPIPIQMDIAFIVDSSRNLRMMDFERIKDFVSSMLDTFMISRNPKTLDNRARVALVQYSPAGYLPRTGQMPVKLEFGFLSYGTKSMMKRYIENSFKKLEGSSWTGHAIEWTLNNIFLSAPNPRRHKVIFLILAGETNVFDIEKLRAVSLQAKCRGFVIFAFFLGKDAPRTNLQELVSAPSDQHLIHLDPLLNHEMIYVQKFVRAFLKSLTLRINRYPYPALQRECQRAALVRSRPEVTPQPLEGAASVGGPETIQPVEEEEFEEGIEFPGGAEAESTTDMIYDMCLLDRDGGICQNYAVKWYFDQEQQGCRQFWYGGCGGNKNRFDTLEECEASCPRSR